MTTKDQDMSEQSTERELFNQEDFDRAFKRYAEGVWHCRPVECGEGYELARTTALMAFKAGLEIADKRARAPLLARIAELEAKVQAAPITEESRLPFDVQFANGKVGKGCTFKILLLRLKYQNARIKDLEKLLEPNSPHIAREKIADILRRNTGE